MSVYDYKIQNLTDFNRLPEVNKLVREGFIESGFISGDYNQQVDLYPHLNTIEETTIITAEMNGKIIGTNSMTLDSPAGLHTDIFFKKETDFIRNNENTILGSSWRIATAQEYRRNFRLFLDLIQNSVFAAKQKQIETCLYIFAKKHEEFYKKILDAETITEKKLTIDPKFKILFVLMRTDTENTQKHLSKIFSKRTFK